MGSKCISEIQDARLRALANAADGHANGTQLDGFIDTEELQSSPDLMAAVDTLGPGDRNFPLGVRGFRHDLNGDGVTTFSESTALKQPRYDQKAMARMREGTNWSLEGPFSTRMYLPFSPADDPVVENRLEVKAGQELERALLDSPDQERVVQGGLNEPVDDCDELIG
ncbi:MAG: hypothetical protein AAF654_03590 [Myxococcota bacterium]